MAWIKNGRLQIPPELARIISADYLRATKPVIPVRRPHSLPIGQYTAHTQTPIANGYGTSIVQAGPGFAAIAIVHTTSATGTGTSRTVTIPATGGPGNTLIVAIRADGTGSNPTVSGVTLGGVPDNFAQDITAGTAPFSTGAVWSDPGCATGQTTLVVSTTGGSGTITIDVVVWEFTGVLFPGPFDKSSSNATGTPGGTWTSNATAVLSQANEVAIGLVCGSASALVITPPGAPWVNTSVTNGSNTDMTAGYNIVSTTAAVTYNGTFAPNSGFTAIVATYKAAATGAGTVKGQATVTVGPQGLGTVWYPVSAAIATTTGANDTSTCQLYMGPLSQLQLVSGTSYAGGGDSIGLGGAPITPGYYIVAVWSGGKAGDVASLAVYGTQNALVRPAN